MSMVCSAVLFVQRCAVVCCVCEFRIILSQYAADDQLAVFFGANRMPTLQIAASLLQRTVLYPEQQMAGASWRKNQFDFHMHSRVYQTIALCISHSVC